MLLCGYTFAWGIDVCCKCNANMTIISFANDNSLLDSSHHDEGFVDSEIITQTTNIIARAM